MPDPLPAGEDCGFIDLLQIPIPTFQWPCRCLGPICLKRKQSVEFTLSPYGPVGISDDNDGWRYNTPQEDQHYQHVGCHLKNVFEQTYKNIHQKCHRDRKPAD